MDPRTLDSREVLMDPKLDWGVSKAASAVNKEVWEVNLEVPGKADRGSDCVNISL